MRNGVAFDRNAEQNWARDSALLNCSESLVLVFLDFFGASLMRYFLILRKVEREGRRKRMEESGKISERGVVQHLFSS